MRKLSVSLPRIATRLAFMIPAAALPFFGCDSGSSDSPANKEASEAHGKAADDAMKNFMKNKPAEAPKKSMPATK